MMRTCHHCWCTQKGDRGTAYVVTAALHSVERSNKEAASWPGVFPQFLLTVTHCTLTLGVRTGGQRYLCTLVEDEGVGEGGESRRGAR